MSRAYFEADAVNWSTLKLLRDSPMAYRHALTHKRADTADLAVGRLVHTLALEPEAFERDYAVWEGGRRAGKEWEAFVEANAGRTIFKPDEIEEAVSMANAVRAHALVQPYLDGGQFEVPLYWDDQATGLRCKARPDWLQADRGVLLDLKTARSIEGRQFGNAAARYGYHCQLAHYAAGVQAALGWTPSEVRIVAVEKTPPHDVAVFVVTEDDLYAGQCEVSELLTRLKAHREADQWPGRYTTEQALQLPAWLFTDDDADADEFGLVIGE